MANDFRDDDLKVRLRVRKGPFRSSDPPDCWEFKGKSRDSRVEAPVLSFKVWVECLDDQGNHPTADIEVRLPNATSAFEALGSEGDVNEADKQWEQLWRENIDEVDRRIREEQDRLSDKCARKYALDWHDVARRLYPGGEDASYYDVQFNLTEASIREVLDTWTEWVRITGGHSQYGCQGSTAFTAARELSSGNLRERARNASGLAFAAPPTV
jgi:hypothetical protein